MQIRLGPDAAPAGVELLAAVDPGDSVRLLGPARLEPRAALLEADGGLRSVGADDTAQTLRAWPMFLVAWGANWVRFELPLGLQLALFVLLGLFSRRMRSARTFPGPQVPERDGPETVQAMPDLPVPADLVRRVAAFVVDLMMLLVLSMICFGLALHPVEFEYLLSAYADAAIRAGESGDGLPRLGPALEALMIDARLLFMLLTTGVLVLTESTFGRSPGKVLLGLRVVRLDGGVPCMGAAATRALMLLIDWFWSFGVVGLLLAGFTRRRQRLGDLLAGTMVVRARRTSDLA